MDSTPQLFLIPTEIFGNILFQWIDCLEDLTAFDSALVNKEIRCYYLRCIDHFLKLTPTTIRVAFSDVRSCSKLISCGKWLKIRHVIASIVSISLVSNFRLENVLLVHFGNMKRLTLEWKNKDGKEDIDFSNFLYCGFPHLEYLKLKQWKLIFNDDFNGKVLSSLPHCNLKELVLDKCDDVNPMWIGGCCPHLEKLTISSSWCNSGLLLVDKVITALSKLPNLHTFHCLSYLGHDDIDDDLLEEEDEPKQLPHLQHLCLQFPTDSLSVTSFVSLPMNDFIQLLSCCPNLITLQLDCSWVRSQYYIDMLNHWVIHHTQNLHCWRVRGRISYEDFFQHWGEHASALQCMSIEDFNVPNPISALTSSTSALHTTLTTLNLDRLNKLQDADLLTLCQNALPCLRSFSMKHCPAVRLSALRQVIQSFQLQELVFVLLPQNCDSSPSGDGEKVEGTTATKKTLTERRKRKRRMKHLLSFFAMLFPHPNLKQLEHFSFQVAVNYQPILFFQSAFTVDMKDDEEVVDHSLTAEREEECPLLLPDDIHVPDKILQQWTFAWPKLQTLQFILKIEDIDFVLMSIILHHILTNCPLLRDMQLCLKSSNLSMIHYHTKAYIEKIRRSYQFMTT